MHHVFVLTPYKLVVGHFLSKYLDSRSEFVRDNTQIHHQIAFQLIMSLDLSFEELMDIIQKPLTIRDPNDDTGKTHITEAIEKDFVTQFRLGLSNLTQMGPLSWFMDRIDFTKDASDKEWAEMMKKHCHPKSMIGMFLRKIVIHFKRLSFNETAMLVRNLSSYIRCDDPASEKSEALNVTQQYLIHQVNMIMNNEKRSLPPENIHKLVEHFYKKHHVFQYQQSIHSNYRMNVRMNHRNAQLDSASSLTNSDNQEGNDITNIFSKSFGHVQSANNFHNDLNYLKFINALRMNDYTLAQESLHQYFDNKDFCFSQTLSADPFAKNIANKKKPGNAEGQSEATNNCWALLNIGIMQAHFRHFDLAYEALEDCVRIARDSNENKCLQYEMIWMLYVLEQLEQPQGTTANVDVAQSKFWTLFNSIFEDVNHEEGSKITVKEYFVTSNLMKLIQINERKLPYVAAMGYLHLEKQLYKQQTRTSEKRQPLTKLLSVEKQLSNEYLRPPFNIKPMLLASRYMMDDVLQRQYSMHSALLNAYGAHHLAAITSKLVARMDFSGVLQEKKFAHCNENHAIAFRNIAFYQWKVCGDSDGALEMLEFFRGYISKYDQKMNSIIRSAKIEIEFDVATLSGQWEEAFRLANTMRCFNVHYSGIMLARLKMLMGNNTDAARLLLNIVADEQLARVAQNVEHNETLMKSFKKTKTTIKVSEPGLRKLPKVNLNVRPRARLSTVKVPKKKPCSETIIIQNAKSKVSVLAPETDPFMWVYGKLLMCQASQNLFDLFNVIELAQNWGYRQLEIKAELELIGIQQRKFGQYRESQARLDEIMIKIIASGIQEDIAQAYYLTAVNHYSIQGGGQFHKTDDERDENENFNSFKQRIAAEMPLKMRLNPDMDYRNYHLLIAKWAIMRAMVIFSRLHSRKGMLDCCVLRHSIEQMFQK